MKTIFGYTYQKLGNGGRLFQKGGLTNRQSFSQKIKKTKDGVKTETYRGTRFDSSKATEYTYKGLPQSQNTIDFYNKQLEQTDLGNYTRAEQIANDFESGKLTKTQAQLLTQKLMNKYADSEALKYISKGEIGKGKSKNIGGFDFELDENNNIIADRKYLNEKIGLLPTLKYNVGKYEQETKGKPKKDQGVSFGVARIYAPAKIKFKDGRIKDYGGYLSAFVSYDSRTGVITQSVPTGTAEPDGETIPDLKVKEEIVLEFPESTNWSDLDDKLVQSRFLEHPAVQARMQKYIQDKTNTDNKTNKELKLKEAELKNPKIFIRK